MRTKNLAIAIIFCAFVLALPLAAQACPGCTNALSNSLGRAFNASVLFMMAMPFTVFGAFVVGFILLHRHTQKNSARIKTSIPQSEPNKEARS